jgi:hypothetical protein
MSKPSIYRKNRGTGYTRGGFLQNTVVERSGFACGVSAVLVQRCAGFGLPPALYGGSGARYLCWQRNEIPKQVGQFCIPVHRQGEKIRFQTLFRTRSFLTWHRKLCPSAGQKGSGNRFGHLMKRTIPVHFLMGFFCPEGKFSRFLDPNLDPVLAEGVGGTKPATLRG